MKLSKANYYLWGNSGWLYIRAWGCSGALDCGEAAPAAHHLDVAGDGHGVTGRIGGRGAAGQSITCNII